MKSLEITPFWFTPKSEEGKPQPTRFQLKPLTGLEIADVNAGTVIEEDRVRYTGRAFRTALQHGLLGWENMLEPNGKVVPFTGNKQDNFSRLRFDIVMQLFDEIMLNSEIKEEAEKN